jgi:hypothetical protein
VRLVAGEDCGLFDENYCVVGAADTEAGDNGAAAGGWDE